MKHFFACTDTRRSADLFGLPVTELRFTFFQGKPALASEGLPLFVINCLEKDRDENLPRFRAICQALDDMEPSE